MPTPTLATRAEILVVEGPLEEEGGRDQDDHDPDPRGPAGSDALLEPEPTARRHRRRPGSTWESAGSANVRGGAAANGGARSTEAVTTSGGGAATGVGGAVAAARAGCAASSRARTRASSTRTWVSSAATRPSASSRRARSREQRDDGMRPERPWTGAGRGRVTSRARWRRLSAASLHPAPRFRLLRRPDLCRLRRTATDERY